MPRSALNTVNAIFQHARANNRTEHIVKALLYKAVLHSELHENSELLFAQEITHAITEYDKSNNVIAASMLRSALAEFYTQYLYRNRWTIAERSTTQDSLTDFRTWDMRRLIETIYTLHELALYSNDPAKAHILQTTPVEAVQSFLIQSPNVFHARRSFLYDLLAHRALEVLQNTANDLPRPEQEFELNDYTALIPPQAFVVAQFSTPDTQSPVYRSIKLYQALISLHLHDTDPEALLDINLLRLRYAHKHITAEDTDSYYLQALEHITRTYAHHKTAAEYLHAQAEVWFQRGNYITALTLCQTAQQQYPESYGAELTRSLESTIRSKELRIQTEKHVLPNTPFLIHVQFRNVTTVYFRLLRIDKSLHSKQLYLSADDVQRLRELQPLSTWTLQLPLTDSNGIQDFKSHSIDIQPRLPTSSAGIPDLPFGEYILVACSREDFLPESSAFAVARFTVSRLAIIHERTSNKTSHISQRLVIADAETGERLHGVKVHLYRQQYNHRKGAYDDILVDTRTTDAQGICTIPQSLLQQHTLLVEATREIHGKRDILRDQTWLTRSYTTAREPYTTTLWFTDRAVYRPGQTIHFKGIILHKNDNTAENTILAQQPTTVTLLDVNGQSIAQQECITNDYGSFHGTFVAPQGVLNGSITIRNEYGSVSIRVEEYKRPKFFVTVEQPQEHSRLGEIVRMSGQATAYAGSAIDGAEVRYRVVREARFPYWCWWWMPQPTSTQKEIARGRVRTDASGRFTIQFLAHPDKSLDPSTLPEFSYLVYVDVTDISGETHSAQARVTIGYTAISLTLDVPEVLFSPITDLPIAVHTYTLNGVGLSTQGTIRIEKLATPTRVVRPRFLPQADRFMLSEQEFVAAFPHDIRHNEHQHETWSVEREIIRQQFTSNSDGTVSLNTPTWQKVLSTLEPGDYRITAEVQDPSGRTITQLRHCSVLNPTLPAPSLRKPCSAILLSPSCSPGDTAKVLLSTPYTDFHILYRIEHRGILIHEEWLKLSREQRILSIPVMESLRGNITVHISAVRHHRLYTESLTLAIPWTNKELRIETSVFREKLRPGSTEEWQLRIRGSHGEVVAAEILASMYDASLDAILPHTWYGFSWQTFFGQRIMHSTSFGIGNYHTQDFQWNQRVAVQDKSYYDLSFSIVERVLPPNLPMRRLLRNARNKASAVNQAPSSTQSDAFLTAAAPAPPQEQSSTDAERASHSPSGGKHRSSAQQPDMSHIYLRKHLHETAFFFPQLRTDTEGTVILSFTMPEALTRWKMLVFAHTPDLKTGMLTNDVLTQKELMVMPHLPRFVREGDTIALPVKVSNLTSYDLAVQTKLHLFDALTMQEIRLNTPQQSCIVLPGRSVAVSWTVAIPEGIQMLTYRVVATTEVQSSSFSDGEESLIPVLSNRMMVTETLPFYIRGSSSGTVQQKTFVMKKLLRSSQSSTLRHHKLTLDVTSHPIWYAIQALPLMMQYPFECAEQSWNRFYANAIAYHIVHTHPRIKAVFEAWQQSPTALLSALHKNEELKALLLTETPWVLDGKSELERKHRIALLFDPAFITHELNNALQTIEHNIGTDGGYAWFTGMPTSRYITQYILCGIGHLQALGITYPPHTQYIQRLQSIASRALGFVDREIEREYQYLQSHQDFNPDHQYLSYDAVHYLYTRSFFPNIPIQSSTESAIAFWKRQAMRFWAQQPLMAQGMIALALHRFGIVDVPTRIMQSLRERALRSEEMGMYWKMTPSWWWWQAPIETQALLMEAFVEILRDNQVQHDIEDMRVWLLQQKRVSDWETTKATAEACYALLLRGQDLLSATKPVRVSLGKKAIDPTAYGHSAIEAGTGHYNVSWHHSEINPQMGELTLTKEDAGIAWGGLYWQYFERLDKITQHTTAPIQIHKKLYLQIPTPQGLELKPITAQTKLSVGDLVKVRIEIRTDHTMEYVHLRDMRGAGFEPVQVLSGYKRQGILGFYATIKDASANFFFATLPQGVHVLEYDLRASHVGTFHNGITSLQCMYAPEFSSHSEGIMVTITP
ncbi:MAG: alpha-2-macroglobulin family protein [Bacteroidota bacterium]|nr:alpha-2-macroglobulin family protein [Bacteroidota bacterium]